MQPRPQAQRRSTRDQDLVPDAKTLQSDHRAAPNDPSPTVWTNIPAKSTFSRSNILMTCEAADGK
jgi:hypothetical protein